MAEFLKSDDRDVALLLGARVYRVRDAKLNRDVARMLLKKMRHE